LNLNLDFDDIEKKLRENSEQYRERHLAVKLSLYAGFFAFEGIAVAAGTFVAARSSLLAAIVIGISFVVMSIIFLHHRWFLRMFDALGYGKISIKSQSDLDDYWAANDRLLAKVSRLKPWRRSLDWLLFGLIGLQMLLLTLAAW
jgi:hypothetical protein